MRALFVMFVLRYAGILCALIAACLPLKVLAVSAPVFSIQPTNLTVLGGYSTLLQSMAAGDPTPTYQWHFNAAASVGRTNRNLYLASSQTTNQGSYFVTASNTAGVVASDVVTLTVITNPVAIWVQPTNATATVGESVRISIVATGLPPPRFQWQFNGGPIPGSGSSVFFSKVQETNAGSYRAILSNSVNSVTSDVAVLTIDPHPLISVHPTNVTGAEVTLHGAAFGRQPLRYQWYYNSSPVPGATNNFLDIFGAHIENSGHYYFTVSNAVGIATSEVAQVTIEPAAVYPGAVDVAFRAGTDQQIVNAVALRPDGRIVVAGWFSSLGDRRLRRFLQDGAVDSSFIPSPGFSNTIRAIALQQDDKLLVGADFEAPQFPSRQKLSRLNSPGTVDNSFAMSIPGLQAIHAIVAQGTDRVIYGGSNYGPGNLVLAEGVPHEEILRDFPYLEPDDIKAALHHVAYTAHVSQMLNANRYGGS